MQSWLAEMYHLTCNLSGDGRILGGRGGADLDRPGAKRPVILTGRLAGGPPRAPFTHSWRPGLDGPQAATRKSAPAPMF